MLSEYYSILIEYKLRIQKHCIPNRYAIWTIMLISDRNRDNIVWCSW